MRPAAGILLASVVLTVSVLVGCGNARSTGPFGTGGAHGSTCRPVRPGGVLTYGAQEFRNSGPATATIEKVTLDDPHNLLMPAAYVVPITGTTLVGVWDGYPTAAVARQAPGIEWALRKRADGALVPPAHGKDVTNLVLVLKPTAVVGTAQAIDVYYRESGQEYHMRTGLTLKVTTGKCFT